MFPPRTMSLINYIVEKLNKQAIRLSEENKLIDKHLNKKKDH